MLNARAVGDLLSRNRDGRLCKRWFVMTPNGTLLAFSQPDDALEVRKRVVAAALAWQDQEVTLRSHSKGSDAAGGRSLQTLILESESENTLMSRFHNHLILVLEAGVPPRKPGFEQRITAEGPDGTVYASGRASALHNKAGLNTSLSSLSLAESNKSSALGPSVLGLHRKKLTAMAAAINADFDATGFRMPEDVAAKYF